MAFRENLFNYWRGRLPTLLDYLGVPFGHEILTDKRPQVVENKTIDGDKNTLLNLGGASVPDATTTTKGKVELAEDNESAPNLVPQANDTRLSNSRSPLAHNHVKADVTDFAHQHVKNDITDFAHTHAATDLPDASTTAKGIVQIATDNESNAAEVVRADDTRLSNARSPLAHNHVTADITDFPDVGEDNTNSNSGTGEGTLVKTKIGADTPIKTIKAGTNVTIDNNADDVTINSSGGGGGEANTTSNQGTGEGTLALAKNGVDLPFKTLKQGANVTITNNANDVTIASTGGGGGEANTSSNVGTGDGQLAKAKSGVDLPFKTIKDGTNLDVVNNVDDVTLNVPDASTTVKGAVELATDGESAANLAVQSNDSRMSNARTPLAHTHVKADVTDFAHTHVKADVTDFSHTHTKSEITDFAHKANHVSGGSDEFVKNDEINAASKYLDAETTDPTSDSKRVFLSGATGQGPLKFWDNQGSPVKHSVIDDQTSLGGDLSGNLPNPSVVAASTTVAGKVELATDGESVANLAVQSNDTRLSNARDPNAHAASHLSNGSDAIAQATTTVRGTVELATDGESAANLVPQANDSRLSNARTPIAHATSHKSGGSDEIKTDEFAAPTDVTTNNASTTAHGFLKKLDNDATHYLNGQGNWVALPAETTGTATGDANGSATQFTIAHGLGSTPFSAFVQVSSVLGSNIAFSFTYDATNITVTFASAPATGTITFQWRAVA